MISAARIENARLVAATPIPVMIFVRFLILASGRARPPVNGDRRRGIPSIAVSSPAMCRWPRLLLLVLLGAPLGCQTMSTAPSMPPADFDAQWDYDDPAGTEAAFRVHLPEAEATWDRGRHAELLTQIARTEGLQRRFDEAHATLDAAEALIDDGDSRAGVRLRLERGRTLNSSGDRAAADRLFVEAWEVASRTGQDGLAVDAAHMVAITRPDETLAWNERALALAESSAEPDARRWRGSLHNNIGWTKHGAGDYDAALAHFEAALACRREEGKPGDVRVARWCVARCHRSLGRIDEALTEQRALAAETPDAPDGYVQEEIAECLLALGRPDEARPHFRRAHELLAPDPWLAESEPERLERLDRLGRDE
jgi:tetratricopeptide (TPR) repeat protein